MSGLRMAERAVLVLPGASQHIWRWDVVSVDNPSHAACSVIFDDRLESHDAVWRRARFLEQTLNERSAT